MFVCKSVFTILYKTYKKIILIIFILYSIFLLKTLDKRQKICYNIYVIKKQLLLQAASQAEVNCIQQHYYLLRKESLYHTLAFWNKENTEKDTTKKNYDYWY